MAGNCDATNGAGLSNAPTPGWDSSADCSSVMNICSPPTGLSSISPASGSRSENVYETRSKKLAKSRAILVGSGLCTVRTLPLNQSLRGFGMFRDVPKSVGGTTPNSVPYKAFDAAGWRQVAPGLFFRRIIARRVGDSALSYDAITYPLGDSESSIRYAPSAPRRKTGRSVLLELSDARGQHRGERCSLLIQDCA